MWAKDEATLEEIEDGRFKQPFLGGTQHRVQFTGLLDKNGKDIYEGDLLQWGDNVLEVRWGRVGWDLFGKIFSFFSSQNGGTCGEHNTEGYTHESEVIGNIYENENLLTTP